MGQSESGSLEPAEMTDRRSLSAGRARAALSTPSDELQHLVDLLRSTTGVLVAAITVEHEGEFHYLVCSGAEPFTNPSPNAFCTLAILDEDTFAIDDLSVDPRTSGMPLVDGTGPLSLRFYASSPLRAPDGELVGRLCLFDEQPRELLENERRLMEVLARNVAAVVDLRMRDEEFASRESHHDRAEAATGRLAHELRTPLVTMSGGLELLREMVAPADDPSVTHVLRLVERSTRRMTELVDSMMRLAHSEHASPVDTDLREVLDQVRHDLGEPIRASAARVVDDGLGTVLCDPGQIRVALQNLVGNALKFTRADVTPVIQARSRRYDDGWRIEVDDNGTGIPADRRDDVFELFTRLTQEPGFGFGLSTVARIVEGHGGVLGVGDVPDGPGTRFWIELPAAP